MRGARRLPFALPAALALCVAAGCGGGEPDETAAGDAGTETPTAASVKPWRPKKRPPFQPGAAIVVAGERVEIGTPVVLWSDPIGYDGYSERCYSAPYQALPVDLASRPSADPRRYGERSTASLSAAERKRVREGGWTLEALKRRITQFVVHYDAVGSSERCFRALHDQRGLSVHFMLDLDGTIWQTLDVKERASHAGAANDRSVGVEIANVGAYSTPKFLEPFYGRNAEGRTVNLFPEEKIFGDQRDLSYVAAPWRNELLSGTVQRRKLVQYDFTEAQYVALSKLAAGLSRALPRIRLEAPRDRKGAVVQSLLPEPKRSAFEGVVGHFHLSEQKFDPGPAFDWEWFLKAARAEAAR